jgi:hypothetical protein
MGCQLHFLLAHVENLGHLLRGPCYLSARPNVIASVQVGGPSTLLFAHVENLAQQSAQFRQLLCNLGRSGCNLYSMDVRDLLEVELLGLNVDCVGGLGDQIRAQSLIQVVEGKGGESS